MIDETECLIGAVIISFGETDLGLTTDDGFELIPDMTEVELDGAQASGTLDAYRPKVKMTGKCTIKQVSQEKLRLVLDLKDAPSAGVLNLVFNQKVTKRALVVTGPYGEKTRTETYTAGIKSVSGYKRGNEYTNVEVEFRLFQNPATGSYGQQVDSDGTTAAPAPASYQWIAANGDATTFADGSTSVDDAAVAIQATFNVAIRPDQLNNSRFMLKANDGNTEVACTVAYGSTTGADAFKKVKLTPTGGLSASTEYELIIAPGLLSNEGVRGSMAAVQFTTTA